jgi:hypothetical protein
MDIEKEQPPKMEEKSPPSQGASLFYRHFIFPATGLPKMVGDRLPIPLHPPKTLLREK